MARPFKKLKGINKECDEYALEYDRRPYVFNFTTEDGGVMESTGSIKPKDCDRFWEIFKELQALGKTAK